VKPESCRKPDFGRRFRRSGIPDVIGSPELAALRLKYVLRKYFALDHG
jgi:hypothetical protein